VTRIGEDESFASYILSKLSDHMPAGEERIETYTYIVTELHGLDLDESLYDIAEDPFDDDLAFVLTREGYADANDLDEEE
jgi:hypothetical protein